MTILMFREKAGGGVLRSVGGGERCRSDSCRAEMMCQLMIFPCGDGMPTADISVLG